MTSFPALAAVCIRADCQLCVDLWWEGRWPTDVADRIDASLPTFLTEEIQKRQVAAIAEADKCVSWLLRARMVHMG